METPAGNRDGKEEMLNVRPRAKQNIRLQRERGKPKELPKSAGMERKWRNQKPPFTSADKPALLPPVIP